jgi:hypothetical protein
MQIESKQQILERRKEIEQELADMLQGKLAIRGQKEKAPSADESAQGSLS